MYYRCCQYTHEQSVEKWVDPIIMSVRTQEEGGPVYTRDQGVDLFIFSVQHRMTDDDLT